MAIHIIMYIHIQLQIVHWTQPPLPDHRENIIYDAFRLAICEPSL